MLVLLEGPAVTKEETEDKGPFLASFILHMYESFDQRAENGNGRSESWKA
jgi:hypothetical protein